MNLESIALRRAQEQYESGAWKDGKGTWRQPEGDHICCVPGCYEVVPKAKHHTGDRCPSCRAAGWIAVACKGCGGRLHRRDQTKASLDRRGYCAACRADMPQRNPAKREPA